MARKSKVQFSPVKGANTRQTRSRDAEHVHPNDDNDQQQPNMGVEQPKEVNAAQTRANTRQSTGKLTRPSRSALNAADHSSGIQNPSKKQRALGPVKGQRRSAYDALESPVKLAPPPGKSALSDLADFSPARGVRARRQQGEGGSAQPGVRSSARKGKGAQQVNETEDGEVAESVEQEEGRFRDLFPDPIVERYRKQRGEVGSEVEEGEAPFEDDGDREDEAEDNVIVAATSTAQKPAKQPAKGKVTRGAKAPSPVALEKHKGGPPGKDGVKGRPGRPTKQRITSGNLSANKEAAAGRKRGQDAEEVPEADEAAQFDVPAEDAVESSTGEYSEEEDPTMTQQQSEKSPSKKRARSSGKAIANMSSKRRRLDVLTEEAEAAEQSHPAASSQRTVSAADKMRMFGQWALFMEIFKAADDIGRPVEGRGVTRVRGRRMSIDLDDSQVKATVKLCRKTIASYNKIRDDTGDDNTEEDPASRLPDLRECIDGLRGKNDAFEYDARNVERCTSIYFHLIPKLLRLLNSAVTCYEKLDAAEAHGGKIKIDHLRIVNRIVRLLIDIINGAHAYHPRPDTSDHVVQPTREIAPSLRDIYRAFHAHIAAHDRQQESERQAEEYATQRAHEEAEEERRKAQQAKYDKTQDEWIYLHKERRCAEGGIPSMKKVTHLERPKLDIDINDVPFERTEMFHPRTGPPPGLVDRAARLVWTEVEKNALFDGLRKRAGDNVFGKVFREYCPAGRELNRFNVTEIVTMAALLRDHVIRDRTARGWEIGQWVYDIPVWINVHKALGKENGEGTGEEDDLGGGGEGGTAVS